MIVAEVQAGVQFEIGGELGAANVGEVGVLSEGEAVVGAVVGVVNDAEAQALVLFGEVGAEVVVVA